MAKQVLFNKNGLITGEPTWSNTDEICEDELNTALIRPFNFYAATVTKKDIREDLFNYLKEQKLPKEKIKAVKSNFDLVPFTAFKLARILNLGFPADKRVNKKLDSYITEVITPTFSIVTEDKTKKPKAKKIAPLQRIKDNVDNDIITRLELMLDEWIDGAKTVKPISLGTIVRTSGVPPQGYKFIYTWLDTLQMELEEAISKSEPYTVEAYSHMTTRQIKSWIRALTKMRKEVEVQENKLKEFKRKLNKNKKKKPANQYQARAQLKRKADKVKYLEEDAELGIKSISPEGIVGARHLYIYNTQHRCFGYITASNRDGLDLRGTSIKNFDEKVSFNIKLRKPEDVLVLFRNKPTVRKIENVVEKLTTKKSKITGRLNGHILILKEFKS